MAKYKYPCVFTYDKEYGGWTAEFPDWQERVVGCTCGNNWQHVKYMAEDLLNLMCMDCEDDKLPLPKVSNLEESVSDKGRKCVRYVEADTNKYRKEVQQYQRVGRFRMAEKARERYKYCKGPQSPEEEMSL